MPQPEEEQPITEADLARMFMEEEQAEAQPPQEEPEPEEPGEPEEPAEPPVEVPAEPPVEEPVPDEPEPVAEENLAEVPEHLSWAERRNLLSFEDAAKLAWEQERYLGQRASEIQELQAELAQARVEQPTQSGRSEQWIAQVLSSPDPARYAFELAQAGDWDTYGVLMQNWEQIVGESVTMSVHQQIQAALSVGEPEEPQGPATAEQVAQAFAAVGIFDLVNDPLAPTIRQVADQLGGGHPLVLGAAAADPVAVSAIVEIARAQTLTTRTVRLDGTPVDESRRAAAGVTGNGGSPSRTPPKPDPLAAETEEWRRMGVLPVE